MEPEEQIERLCNRFEIAVSNFGRSCIDMQANEKAFQAWYASSVIQEFGISHVYREIHLWKKELFLLAPPNKLTAQLEKGNELFPDISISWFPNLDTRHSSTRDPSIRDAGSFLSEFSVLSELKVTGSTSTPTPKAAILKDIAKLYVFMAAHRSFTQTKRSRRPLRSYMVILDNARNSIGKFKKTYSKEKTTETLKEAKNYWKNGIRPPDIILIHPGKLTARVSILKELNDWIDLD